MADGSRGSQSAPSSPETQSPHASHQLPTTLRNTSLAPSRQTSTMSQSPPSLMSSLDQVHLDSVTRSASASHPPSSFPSRLPNPHSRHSSTSSSSDARSGVSATSPSSPGHPAEAAWLAGGAHPRRASLHEDMTVHQKQLEVDYRQYELDQREREQDELEIVGLPPSPMRITVPQELPPMYREVMKT